MTSMSTPVSPVVYAVTVNGSPVSETILDVSLEMEWGRHDIASMRIEYNRGEDMSAIVTWPSDALVTMTWGQGVTGLETWYGYVNHYEMKSNADSGMHNLQVTYYCIGTSYPMNSQKSYTWGNVTGTFVAKH